MKVKENWELANWGITKCSGGFLPPLEAWMQALQPPWYLQGQTETGLNKKNIFSPTN